MNNADLAPKKRETGRKATIMSKGKRKRKMRVVGIKRRE